MTQLRSIYLIVANTALLFCAVQVGAAAILVAYDTIMPRVFEKPMTDAVRRNFAHMSPQDFRDLALANARLRFRYEIGIGVLQDAIESRLLNVDEHSIRANGPSRRPIAALDGAVWFLGGSTAFGDFIADHETIPAQLERAIGRPVINLGVPSYATRQENVLFAHYLRLGYRPVLALFLDGVNEACQPEPYMEEVRELFRRAQLEHFWNVGGPAQQLAVRSFFKLGKVTGWYRERDDDEGLTCVRHGVTVALADIHRRLLAERAALCGAYQVDCRTIVQPFAGTHGPTADLPKEFLDGNAQQLRAIFTALEPRWRAAGATFVTDVFDDYHRHPFVDEVHYSAEASRVIAEAIATRLGLR